MSQLNRPMVSAEDLLHTTLSLQEASTRSDVTLTTFPSAGAALEQWVEVLIHEAREDLQKPLSDPPEDPYLHPVDVDTHEPGIVHTKGDVHVLRPPSKPFGIDERLILLAHGHQTVACPF